MVNTNNLFKSIAIALLLSSCVHTHKIASLIKVKLDSLNMSYKKDVYTSLRDSIFNEITFDSTFEVDNIEFTVDSVGKDSTKKYYLKPHIKRIRKDISTKIKHNSTLSKDSTVHESYDSTRLKKDEINKSKDVTKTHAPFWIYIVGVILILIIILIILKKFKLL